MPIKGRVQAQGQDWIGLSLLTCQSRAGCRLRDKTGSVYHYLHANHGQGAGLGTRLDRSIITYMPIKGRVQAQGQDWIGLSLLTCQSRAGCRLRDKTGSVYHYLHANHGQGAGLGTRLDRSIITYMAIMAGCRAIRDKTGWVYHYLHANQGQGAGLGTRLDRSIITQMPIMGRVQAQGQDWIGLSLLTCQSWAGCIRDKTGSICHYLHGAGCRLRDKTGSVYHYLDANHGQGAGLGTRLDRSIITQMPIKGRVQAQGQDWIGLSLLTCQSWAGCRLRDKTGSVYHYLHANQGQGAGLGTRLDRSIITYMPIMGRVQAYGQDWMGLSLLTCQSWAGCRLRDKTGSVYHYLHANQGQGAGLETRLDRSIINMPIKGRVQAQGQDWIGLSLLTCQSWAGCRLRDKTGSICHYLHGNHGNQGNQGNHGNQGQGAGLGTRLDRSIITQMPIMGRVQAQGQDWIDLSLLTWQSGQSRAGCRLRDKTGSVYHYLDANHGQGAGLGTRLDRSIITQMPIKGRVQAQGQDWIGLSLLTCQSWAGCRLRDKTGSVYHYLHANQGQGAGLGTRLDRSIITYMPIMGRVQAYGQDWMGLSLLTCQSWAGCRLRDKTGSVYHYLHANQGQGAGLETRLDRSIITYMPIKGRVQALGSDSNNSSSLRV